MRWRRRRGRRCWGRSRRGRITRMTGITARARGCGTGPGSLSGTAADHTAWVKRGAGHPAVMAALVTRKISRSYAREICRWTDKLPEDARGAADGILLAAAASGLELPDLAGLAGEMYEKSRQDKPDADPGDGEGGSSDPAAAFDDRSVRLATTLGGAGVVHGALTPECAEFVKTVLDALSAPTGADDDRTHEQRYHDALRGGYAAAGRGRAGAAAGRAAGEGLGVHLAGRPDGAGRQRGPGGGVDGAAGGPVGRAPGRRRRGGRASGAVAGRGCGAGDCVRRAGDAGGGGGREPGRVR